MGNDYIKEFLTIQQDFNYKPQLWDDCKISFQGDTYATVSHVKNKVQCHAKRIDLFHYQNVKTGEIKMYETLTREEAERVRIRSMKRAFGELTGLIRTNFTNAKEYGGMSTAHNQKFIMLSYRENMTDEQRLYIDFKYFIDRLEYEYPHDYEYISVVEPQGRGAWHIHLMLKASDVSEFWIDKEKLTKIWGHGATQIQELKSNDVGAYYTAYFTGVFSNHNGIKAKQSKTGDDAFETEQRLTEAVEAYSSMTGLNLSERQKELKKKHLKGARVSMYPKGMRFYRCSRGVDRPEKVAGTLISLSGYKKVYERGYSIDNTTEMTNPETGEVITETENLNKVYHSTYRKKGVDE